MEAASPAKYTSKYLPDFYKIRNGGGGILGNNDWVPFNVGNGGIVAIPKHKGKGKTKKPVVEKPGPTPKDVYKLELLNDKVFELKTNPEYVDKELLNFKDKLNLLKAEEYDMRNGVEEVTSIVMRLENRKKYGEVKEYFEAFPYTTGSKIDAVLGKQKHLQLGQIAQFVADMPKEAIDAMKKYNEGTQKLCGKDAVFYIIADQKDFKKVNSRRDPILLAQSPFGHFWQILGAWDKEMIFLEQL